MPKARYTPLNIEGGAVGGGSANTYSSINAATATTAGASVAQPPPPPPLQHPTNHRQHSHRIHGGSRIPTSPFACGCVPIVAAFIAARLPARAKSVGYTSGFLFAVGWWLFIDGLVFSSTRDSETVPAARFEDWLPGLLSTLSLLIVNMIDKDSLNADDFSYAGSNVACKARACAFVGITMAMGALGGGFAILALKYLMPGLEGEDIYFGIMIALQNVFIFVGSMTLWFGRNSAEDAYESYSF